MRFFLMFLLFIALPAASAPKDEVREAFSRLLAMTSFKADINSVSGKQKAKSRIEFQAPDHYRITNDGQSANLIIGSIMYMNMNGSLMKIPMPGLKAMMAQYHNPDMLKELEAGVFVESLGTETINNQLAKKYRYTTTQPLVSNNILWVASNGNIIQLETTGSMNKKSFLTLIQYSQYNSPAIKISQP